MVGVVQMDPDGCPILRSEDGDEILVLWPVGYEYAPRGGRLVILNERAEPVLDFGEAVTLYGRYLSGDAGGSGIENYCGATPSAFEVNIEISSSGPKR